MLWETKKPRGFIKLLNFSWIQIVFYFVSYYFSFFTFILCYFFVSHFILFYIIFTFERFYVIQ